jgi:hypothetical protein
VKKKSQKEMDREIISSVKKEMALPRLAASVREDLAATATLAARALAVHPIKA